ncbi:ABC transporter ATP-binding protein/permease [Orbaceae bacterium ESL0727]|nr:ABC transporter ATP-binding protein/permease [Orbaceae bacterium ESL0727]
MFKPFWTSKQSWLATFLLIIILVMIFATVKIQVLLNDWNSDFFNALGKTDNDKLIQLIFWFIAIIAVYLVIAVNKVWLIKILHIRWRQWLTDYYLKDWLVDKRYYHYALSHASHNNKHDYLDNPDQRIAEDIDQLVDKTLSLALGFIQSFGMLVTFIIVLWKISGTLTFTLLGYHFNVTGYLVYGVFIFVAINTGITHLIGKKIRRLNVIRQRNEANFRSALIHQQEYAEQIALLDGEATQKQKLTNCFSAIQANWHQLINRQRRLDYWQTIHQHISAIIPLFLLIPQFIAGLINLGDLMKARQAFMLVSNNLSWFIFKYDLLAELAAIVDRLYQFHLLITQHNTTLTQTSDHLAVKNGTIKTPQGDTLLTGIDFSMQAGEWLLLHGHSGIGKTTLLRTMMGIWPYATGTFLKPANCLMVTQMPYIADGTLTEALCYPKPCHFSAAQLSTVLQQVQLAYLIPHLNASAQWQKRLSSGEKQRIGIARVLLFKPDWLFLDEAISHLDALLATQLFTLIKQQLPKTGVMLVSHQQIAHQLIDKVYRL